MRTDHSALQALLSKPIKGRQAGRIARWAIRIAPYQFEVEYRSGKENQIADTLLRLPNELAEHCNAISENREEQIVLSIFSSSTVETITEEKFMEESNRDKTVQRIIEDLRNSNTESWKSNSEMKKYWKIRDELAICNGKVLRNGRTVIPNKLQSKFIEMFHEGNPKIRRNLEKECGFPDSMRELKRK